MKSAKKILGFLLKKVFFLEEEGGLKTWIFIEEFAFLKSKTKQICQENGFQG